MRAVLDYKLSGGDWVPRPSKARVVHVHPTTGEDFGVAFEGTPEQAHAYWSENTHYTRGSIFGHSLAVQYYYNQRWWMPARYGLHMWAIFDRKGYDAYMRLVLGTGR